MSDSKAPSQVDPALPPSESRGEKAQPVDPSKHRGISKLPKDVKGTLSRVDELVLQLTRFVIFQLALQLLF
jgi:hypothetical protein